MRKGFTLVELMIVIAIIAIIIAIAIPNLLSGRISANETSAIGTLKQLTSTEAIWLQQGPDGNGMKDYWTYDLSGLHRCLRAGSTPTNIIKVAFIPVDIAQADCRSAYDGAAVFGGLGPLFEGDWTVLANAKWQPKSGYWFTVLNYFDNQVMDVTTEYNQNDVVQGDDTTKACNFNHYGFMAAPDAYGNSGVRTFIVNEAGVIYAADIGVTNSGTDFPSSPLADAPGTAGLMGGKWTTDNGGSVLAWPGSNPMLTQTVSNKYWQSAE